MRIVYSNDDKTSPAILHIRPNLEAALRYLRNSNLPRLLWIDAICINQKDLHERSVQVKRMTDIYSWASRVVVWIGFESVGKSTEEALKFLEKLGGQVEHGRRGLNSILSSDDEFCDIAGAHMSLPCHPQDFLEIGKILHHPWWTRLWVRQEVHLGSIHTILQCGSTTALWRDVRKAIIVLFVRDSRGSEELWDVVDFDHLAYLRLFCLSHHNDNFTNLISRTNRAKYAVLHDRIFALFGLLPKAFVINVTANYSLPIEEVFRDVCLAQVECSNSLDFLQQADRLDEEASALDLPSWIPDFTQIPKRHLSLGFATERSRCGAVHYNEDLQLQVSAVFCGTIECIGRTVPNQEASNDWESIISDWEEILSATRNTPDFASDASLRKKFVDVLRAGQIDDYYGEHGDGLYADMEEYLTLYKERNWLALPYPGLRGTTFFTAELNSFSKGGTLGAGPPKAMPGDRIAVLLGYNFPVVLRLVTPSTRQDALPTYQLIGSAYVVDFMDTEALLGPLPEGYRIVHLLNQQGGFVQKFIDTKTGEATYVDPRLGPLPDGWHFAFQDTMDRLCFWRDGEEEGEPSTIRDPRLELDELKKRGAGAKLILLA